MSRRSPSAPERAALLDDLVRAQEQRL
jgi:hypothetical protein